MQTRSQIRFCSVGGQQRLAVLSQGSGPVVVLAPWCVSHLERDVEEPKLRAFYERLAARYTVVRYDHTGVGASDRERTDFSLEREVAELGAVVDTFSGGGPVTLIGGSFGGPVATGYAARHPQRVARLVLYATFATGAQVAPPQVQEAMVGLVRAHWWLAAKTLTGILAPTATEEEARLFTKNQFDSASANTAAALHRLFYDMDVRELAGAVRAPTLVVHRRNDHAIPLTAGLDVASRIPGATMLTLEGQSHLPWLEGNGVLDAVLPFLSSDGTVEPPPPTADDAELVRSGDVWAIAWGGSRLHVKHAKGLQDIALLVQNPGTSIAALLLAEGAPPGQSEPPAPVLPDAERARKAVTARLRDAIARVRHVHPELGAHLEGAISTGLNCVYKPERPIRWKT